MANVRTTQSQPTKRSKGNWMPTSPRPCCNWGLHYTPALWLSRAVCKSAMHKHAQHPTDLIIVLCFTPYIHTHAGDPCRNLRLPEGKLHFPQPCYSFPYTLVHVDPVTRHAGRSPAPACAASPPPARRVQYIDPVNKPCHSPRRSLSSASMRRISSASAPRAVDKPCQKPCHSPRRSLSSASMRRISSASAPRAARR